MEYIFQDTLYVISKIPQEKSVKYRGLLTSRHTSKIINKCHILVSNVDCIDECIRISKEKPNAHIGLLNMASERVPGGGVVNGRLAQEESICRMTTLYPTLKQQRYPLASDEIIYSPNIKVVKGSDYSLLKTPINIAGVVSAAALRRPILDKYDQYDPRDLELVKKKVQMVLETFEYHNITHLVLGAWGCGVFRNPPDQVAHVFQEVLNSFNFEHITFAITTFKPHDQENLDAFGKVFGKA